MKTRWLVVLSLLVSGCAPLRPTATAPRVAIRESKTIVSLHGKTLDVHLARPAMLRPDAPLVVYASGDGGWFGAAVDMWRQMATNGYAAAGFSSRALLSIERPAGAALSPARLSREYGVIIRQVRQALGLPADGRVVLAGWSRGAAFSVLVGAEPQFRSEILGVVAIGLADGEDLTIGAGDDDTDDGTARSDGRRRQFDTYARLARLTSRCALIQATHDNYFSAARARERFGPDTPARRFYAVEAKNHRFSGGKAGFDAALFDALRWISSDGHP